MSNVILTTGDDVSLAVTLKKNNSTFNIPVTATVEASLITPDRGTILISPIVQLDTTPGADWANSLVIVLFTSAQTDINFDGDAILEIQVNDNGKLTWFASLTVIKGTIA